MHRRSNKSLFQFYSPSTIKGPLLYNQKTEQHQKPRSKFTSIAASAIWGAHKVRKRSRVMGPPKRPIEMFVDVDRLSDSSGGLALPDGLSSPSLLYSAKI